MLNLNFLHIAVFQCYKSNIYMLNFDHLPEKLVYEFHMHICVGS